jgi:hypothetical protein
MVAHVHLDADAGIPPTGALVELCQAVRSQKDRMRVVELEEQTIDGSLVEIGVRHRVDVESLNVGKHLVE